MTQHAKMTDVWVTHCGKQERAEIFINESIAYGSGYRFGPGYGPVHPFYRTIDFFEREDRSYSLK